MGKQFLNIFLLLATSIFVIALAYYATAIIGQKTKNLLKNKNIQVLERTSISFNLNIVVVKVNKKIYILAIQNKEPVLLDTIDETEWKFQDNIEIKNCENDLIKKLYSYKKQISNGKNDKSINSTHKKGDCNKNNKE